MATTILRSSHHLTVCSLLGLFSLLVLTQKGSAREFKVGGSDGWTVPSIRHPVNYNLWAEKNRFQIGDTLVFDYPAQKDAVLRVMKEDYDKCSTNNPITTKNADGHTTFKILESGPYYFISGVKDNCLKNEKLVVVVLADRTHRSGASSIVISITASIAAFLVSSLPLVF